MILSQSCGWKRTWKNSGLTASRTLTFKTTGRNALPIELLKHASKLSIYSEPKECHERTPLELASSFPCSSRVLLATLRNGQGENKTTTVNYYSLQVKKKKTENENCHSLASYTWVDGINWPLDRHWEAICNVSIAIPLLERMKALWVVCGLYNV